MVWGWWCCGRSGRVARRRCWSLRCTHLTDSPGFAAPELEVDRVIPTDISGNSRSYLTPKLSWWRRKFLTFLCVIFENPAWPIIYFKTINNNVRSYKKLQKKNNHFFIAISLVEKFLWMFSEILSEFVRILAAFLETVEYNSKKFRKKSKWIQNILEKTLNFI